MENTLSHFNQVISALASQVPAEIDFLTMLKFIAVFGAGMLILSTVARVVLGKRSNLNHAFSSAIGILFIYVVTIIVLTFAKAELGQYLAPLPFVTFTSEYLYILPLSLAELPELCHHVLSMVILAFLVNLLDTIIPKGRSILGWYLLRFVTVLLSMVLHTVVSWAFNAFLPEVLVTYAPIILLGILAAMLLLGVLNVLLGLVLTVVNPILGAIYTFFFSNVIGKQLSKAVLTTAILVGIIAALERFGYLVICISAGALSGYLPLVAVLLILWYLIGHAL